MQSATLTAAKTRSRYKIKYYYWLMEMVNGGSVAQNCQSRKCYH